MGRPQLRKVAGLWRLLASNRDALVCLFDQGVVSVAGFVTSVLIGRMASAELGVYYIGMTMVLFARGFQQQLVSTPYTIYHHRRSASELPSYRGSCLLHYLVFLVVTSAYLILQIALALVSFAILAWICWGDAELNRWVEWLHLSTESAQVVPTLSVLLILIPVVLLREVVRHYCFTHSKNVSVLGLDTAVSILQVLALLGLGYFGLLSGASAWAAIGVCCGLVIAFWYFRYGPAIKFERERIPEDWKLNWSFGKWAVSGQFVGSLPTYLLPWLLLDAAGAEGTGYFAACMTLVGVANIFNVGMLNFLTPKAASVYVNEGNTGLNRLLLRMYGLFLVAVGGFTGFLAISGGFIAVNLFGPDYAGLEVALILLSVAKLFEGFSHTASAGLFAMEKIKANFWVDVILMVVTITAALLLVKPFGVLGVAWTSLISSATSAILRSGLLFKFLNMKPIVVAAQGGAHD